MLSRVVWKKIKGICGIRTDTPALLRKPEDLSDDPQHQAIPCDSMWLQFQNKREGAEMGRVLRDHWPIIPVSWCGGLNEIRPYRLIYLNMWFLVGI